MIGIKRMIKEIRGGELICKGCGKDMPDGTYGKYCPETMNACRQKAYRKGEKGKRYTEEYNKRYKRPDIEKICEVCGMEFKTARSNQYVCSKVECRKGGLILAKDRMFARNPNLKESYRHIDNLRKKVKRGTIEKPVCCVCGTSEGVQYHHPDYSKPTEVISLCKKHYTERHIIDIILFSQ